MFISFEGIDGCGKSTQAKLLAESLREYGREILLMREPGDTRLSEAIRSLLLDKQNNEMTARTELLLFSAARAQLVETVICPALQHGTVVLCDRYADSTIAYQAFGRGLPMEDIQRCNAVATAGLKPDLTFYIAIDVEMAHERADRLGEGRGDRIERAGKEFFQRVIEGYEWLVQTEPQRFLRIDGNRSIDEVREDVWKKVYDRLVGG